MRNGKNLFTCIHPKDLRIAEFTIMASYEVHGRTPARDDDGARANSPTNSHLNTGEW